MCVVIRFNGKRNRFIARRGETAALLLFFVVNLQSDLRPTTRGFFFVPRVTKRKVIFCGSIDHSTHAWNFDTLNPSRVKHRRMQRCRSTVDTLLFFFFFIYLFIYLFFFIPPPPGHMQGHFSRPWRFSVHCKINKQTILNSQRRTVEDEYDFYSFFFFFPFPHAQSRHR